jgi:hypothetical protein
MGYTIRRVSISSMSKGLLINFVLRYYFQHNIERLSTCTLTIHALLHIPEDIRNSGPIWAYWCFVMERHCGILLRAVKSKLNPWGSLAQRAKRISQLQLLNVLYNLWDVLRQFQPLEDDLRQGEWCYKEDPICKCLL